MTATKLNFLFFCAITLLTSTLNAQNFYSKTDNVITLDNGIISRMIVLEDDDAGFQTISYQLKNKKLEFVRSSEDFYFEVNGNPTSGLDNWKFVSENALNDKTGGKGVKIILENNDQNLKIGISYLLYPNLPIIRKKN